MPKRERFYYQSPVSSFLVEDPISILGKLVAASEFDVDIAQREAWRTTVTILKSALADVGAAHLVLEYSIPRMGKRADAVLLLGDRIVVIEMKVGASSFDRSAILQVHDYALDLKYFHHATADIAVVPVLVATEARTSRPVELAFADDAVASPLLLNPSGLKRLVSGVDSSNTCLIDYDAWLRSPYRPAPTIIEAAQALFRDHGVDDISRTDASAENLAYTAQAISKIIEDAKANGRKAICLVTGVPGSGKTLAGLVIANERKSFEHEHAVFLSGNGPLVNVLREALARDSSERNGTAKSIELRKSKAFIQNIHHFRDDALLVDEPPIEKVTVFDEAQRAWDSVQLARFMKEKKGVADFSDSEPEFLIRVMDRHTDWAVIVCLIGSGQEINTGEAGLGAWLDALETSFPHWQVHMSPQVASMISPSMTTSEEGISPRYDPALHLQVSLRSFRSERLSEFVSQLLLIDADAAVETLATLLPDYPIAITRDRDRAKHWLKEHARGSERYGQVASSRAYRLRAHGVWVQVKPDPVKWFLNDASDVRSSNALEETAREYDIQGLELDWALVGWDADLRFVDGAFRHYAFRGDKWTRINQVATQTYLTNAYRVLLTRARQGMIVYVPPGDDADMTRSPSHYDGTYQYLTSLGIPEI